jgi:hypothetical protein
MDGYVRSIYARPSVHLALMRYGEMHPLGLSV